MAFVPKFTLWDSTGTTLLYTFNAVFDSNAPQTVRDSVQINNLRAQGSIIVDGGEKSWVLNLKFALVGTDYSDVTAQIDTLESTILLNTPYLLLLDKTISTFYQFKVKRTQPFEWLNVEENRRNTIQKINSNFLVNSW